MISVRKLDTAKLPSDFAAVILRIPMQPTIIGSYDHRIVPIETHSPPLLAAPKLYV